MSREVEFILGCIAPNAVAGVPDGLDWGTVVRIGRAHGILPLLASRAQAPSEIRPLLGTALRANAHWNLRLVRELLAILDLLEARGVRAMPFKGPVLALSLYGDLGLRESEDLDLLVRREDVGVVTEALFERGYTRLQQFRGDQQAAVLRSSCELHFRHENGLAVEPHWAIAPRYFACRFEMDEVWRGAKPAPFCGRAVLQPRPEHLLFLLMVHGLRHCWSSLKWLADVAWLINTRSLDWARLTRLAERSGMVRAVGLGCYLASDLLGATAAEAIGQRASADGTLRKLAAQVRRGIAAAPQPAWQPRRALFQFRARERWRDRLSFAVQAAFMPLENDFAAVSLPRLLNALYYPFHAGRLAVKYGLDVLRM